MDSILCLSRYRFSYEKQKNIYKEHNFNMEPLRAGLIIGTKMGSAKCAGAIWALRIKEKKALRNKKLERFNST